MTFNQLHVPIPCERTAAVVALAAGEEGSSSQNRRLFPSWRALLIFAVILPAAMAGTCHLFFQGAPRVPEFRPYLYPWMVMATGILSWCSGRYLQPAWLGWIVFGWCMVLLDLLTIVACQNNLISDHFGFVLVSAQLTLIVLWTVLAPVGWQWRLPGSLFAAPIVFMLAGSLSSGRTEASWNGVMTFTVGVSVVLSLVLCWLGFSLRQQSSMEAANGSIHVYQFGVKHMLVWATAMVPILLTVRGIDRLLFASLNDTPSVFAAILLAVSLATLHLIAIWAVLGSGIWILRVATLLLMPIVLAIGLTHYSSEFQAINKIPWNRPPIINMFVEMQDGWSNWLWLDAALLAALLLFLRANEYRLMRIKRVP